MQFGASKSYNAYYQAFYLDLRLESKLIWKLPPFMCYTLFVPDEMRRTRLRQDDAFINLIKGELMFLAWVNLFVAGLLEVC